MIITVAKTAGFCNGVKTAFNRCVEIAKDHDKIYMVGELVHNEDVVKALQEKKVEVISQEDAKSLKGGVAVIKAGGVEKGLVETLKNNGVEVYDLTCPVVKKIHDIIEERSAQGDEIIIIGNPNHDEVIASKTYSSSRIEVVPVSEYESIKIGEKPVSIVFQTTVLPEIVQKVSNFLKLTPFFSNKSFVIYNTVCYTTTKQQEDISSLASQNDAVIVIGDKRSSNTRNLFEVAKRINKNSYFCEGKSDSEEIYKKLDQKNSIAITGGASTPPWLIEEVVQSMSDEIKKTAEEAKAVETASTEALTMEELLKENDGFIQYFPGKRVECTVLTVTDEGLFVAVGGKKDGFIDKSNTSIDGSYNKADYKKGDTFQAQIIEVKDYVYLSKKSIDQKKIENEKIREDLLGQFEVKIDRVDEKGKGVRARYGSYDIFIPASQLEKKVKDLNELIGTTMTVELLPQRKKKIVTKTEVDADGVEKEVKVEEFVEEPYTAKSRFPKSLVASARIIKERDKIAKAKEDEDNFWNSIKVNDVVTGKVKRFTEFGAFVSVKGHDCLAHVSELSWSKVAKPQEVLEEGKEYDFVILKLDRNTNKISLGYKQLQKKPYELAAEKYPIGTIIKGTIERVFSYGAFVKIDDGVDGLVHVSQISHKWTKDATTAVQVGQEVEAKIIGFEGNRITLSIKELLPPPEVTEEAKAEDGAEGEEKKAAKGSRTKKFEQRVEEGDKKKSSRAKKEKEEKTESAADFISGTSSSTAFADLLKDFQSDKDKK